MAEHCVIALAGNQNSGKTTLFNALTGLNQHVGNWPGVTVERKTGQYRAPTGETAEIVDLPGVYSLRAFTPEERVTSDYLTWESPSAVLNVVDATCPEHGLYLTLELLLLGRPVVVALNMADEVRARGDALRPEKLAARLGVPVVCISARRGEGVAEAARLAMAAARGTKAPPECSGFTGDILKTAETLRDLVRGDAARAGISAGYASAALLAGNEELAEELALPRQVQAQAAALRSELEKKTGMPGAAAVANARYALIEQMVGETVARGAAQARTKPMARLDQLLARPALAFPLFMALLLAVFWITFGPLGTRLSAGFSALVDGGIGLMDGWLVRAQVAPFVREMAVEGILTGVGSVLKFLPTILLLFLCLSLMEDSGLMARAAFLTDPLLRRVGLSGRSFIPMLMGFGCTVPAVMAARTMRSRRDRNLTVLLTPFLSCGAKAPVYALFAGAFFGGRRVEVMALMYFAGVAAAVAAGAVLRRAAFSGEAEPLLLELPGFRVPTLRSVLRQMQDKAGDFMQRAFTVVFLSVVLVWAAQSVTFGLTRAQSIRESILGTVGGFLAPLLAPCGFGTAEAATALLTGALAKESVVSTLAVMLRERGGLAALPLVFPSAWSAASFLAFVLLYAPCAAALAAMGRELESRRAALGAALRHTGLAWCVSAVIYQIGQALGG